MVSYFFLLFIYFRDRADSIPRLGSDTVFASQVEAYNRLSEALKERLHGLKAVHSGFEQAAFSRDRDGVVMREPIKNEHPIVRTHPVTGEKALFINTGCKFHPSVPICFFTSVHLNNTHYLKQSREALWV